jgi:hypothetical protein
MGMIFSDSNDEQVDAMMRSSHLGNLWSLRYLKIKAIIYGSIATVSGIGITAVTDYFVFKWTDHSGIIGWMFG